MIKICIKFSKNVNKILLLVEVAERWLSGKSRVDALPEDPYISSQLSVTPVPLDPVPLLFWSLWAAGMYVVHRHTCRQNTHTHKILIKNTDNQGQQDGSTGKGSCGQP